MYESNKKLNFFLILQVFILLVIFPVFLSGYDTFNPDNAPSSGLGGAYTAYENNPEVLFYNPGAFYSVKNNILHIDYNKYFTGLSTESSLTSDDGYYPVSIYSWALSMISPLNKVASLGGYVSSLSFSGLYSLFIFGFSVSSDLGKLLDWDKKLGTGLTLKYLQKKYESTPYNEDYFKSFSSSISGISFDIGFMYSVTKELNLGLSFINVLSSDMGTQFEDKGVRHYKLGIKYSKEVNFVGRNQLNILMDFDYYSEDFNIAAGGELKLLSTGIIIRTGINLNYVSAGLGYVYNEFISANYALNYYISAFEGTSINHKVNCGVKF